MLSLHWSVFLTQRNNVKRIYSCLPGYCHPVYGWFNSNTYLLMNSFLLENKEAVMIGQQTNKVFREDLGSQQD